MWLLYTFSLPISVPLLISVKFSFPSLSESRLSNKTFWAGAAWSYFLVGRQYFYFNIIWETFQKTCCRPRWNSSSKKMSPYIVQNLRKSYFVQNLRKSYIGRNIGKEWFNDRHLLVGLWGNTLLHSPPGYNSIVNLSFNLPIKFAKLKMTIPCSSYRATLIWRVLLYCNNMR